MTPTKTPPVAPRPTRVGFLFVWVLFGFLVGCDGFRFAGSVVGGDASDEGFVGLDLPPFDGPATHPDADASAPSDRMAMADGGCTSHAGCSTPEAPVCDPGTGRCVACTPTDDRCPRGQYCHADMFSCVDGCRSDDDCASPATSDAAVLPRRFCDIGRRVCVQCRRDAECPTGQFCAGGSCEPGCSPTLPCPAGRTCCGGACVDTQSNRAHCGACGRACTLAHAAPDCREGRCTIGTCMDPWGDCDGIASNGCETDLRSVNHCGACDQACPVRVGATTLCEPSSRTCRTRCNEGFEDCNGSPVDGCEAALATDIRHCGGCGRECRLAHASPVCRQGACAVAACDPGWGDCDGNPANGCETPVESSTSHCGACGRACPVRSGATPRCSTGVCSSVCAPDRADCNGRAEDGCEVALRIDPLHCGGCDRPCRPANATGQCLSGACEIAACQRGFLDCDGDPSNGCEADLATSARHCGACGRSCTAGQVCLLGNCVVDCGLLTRCGASCVDTRTDAAHCGTCGRACAVDETCVSGVCTLACLPPTSLCMGRCVSTRTDAAHCGACGRRCPSVPNATPVCTLGACGFACLPGFADCDGIASNGCEVDTATDPRHCGSCGTTCAFANASSSCSAGRCVLGACAAGAGNCDGIASNGCETTLATDRNHCGRCGNACLGPCRDGSCTPAVTIDRPTVINTTAAPIHGTRGTRTVTLLGSTSLGLSPGTRVVIHQTQGPATTAGSYEFNTVTGSSGASVQLANPLRADYTTLGAAHAQLVVVQTYNDLVIGPTGELTAPEWNGSTGGILAVEARGVVLVDGAIRMNGRGFRGPSRSCPSAGTSNRCRYGRQGESWTGLGDVGPMPNGGGGGGGGQGEDCGSGGGGAYGPNATPGTPGDCGRPGSTSGFCALRCPNEGGSAGMAYGAASLASTIHLGSAGGEGGMDEDGDIPGAGGHGGGVILLRADGAITVRGSITAGGADGRNGDQFSCGGSGCGMGGGGGGAGGGIWIAAPSVNLGTGLVTATGGAGGQCSCRILNLRRAAPAGRGGDGRIAIASPMVTGSTLPAYESP